MTALTILEWTYEPKSFFEEPITVLFAGGEIKIASGSAKGRFDEALYRDLSGFRDAADEFLRATFLAHQVQVQKPFTLTSGSIALEHADGRRDVTIMPEPIVIQISVGQVDFIHTSGDGTVLADSRADRLSKHAQFRNDVSVLLPHDLALKRMLQSYNYALTDRDNMLIHLYEIRETLSAEFSGDRPAQNAVDVSATEWKKFGRLANDEPLVEGRHRGKHLSLRKAKADEVAWALSFGQRLIEGYVKSRSAS